MVILNILLFVVTLSILIFVHELGHFIFAKLFGVYCHEFSLGMGPAIFKKKFKKDRETTYSLRALPIGGYVAMAGESTDNEEDKAIPYERTINGIKPWKRAIVIVAGATMNFILGLILTIIVAFSGKTAIKETSVIEVEQNSFAYVAGLRSNDLITKIVIEGDNSVCSSGCLIENGNQLFDYIGEASLTEVGQSQEITFFYSRGEVEDSTSIIRTYDEKGQSIIGISRVLYKPGFFEGIKLSFQKFGYVISSMFKSIGSLFSKDGFSQLGGPVQIYLVSTQQASQGFSSYVWFMAVLSINLGFFNLLPIPGLDGSRFIVSILEMITRKKFNVKVESYINLGGMILLLALILAVTIKDVIGLF